MGRKLVEVSNWNFDASMLFAEKELSLMEGEHESEICKGLKTYVKYEREVNLGPIGATVRDIAEFNPEAIDIINENTDIFEIIPRPYSHDLLILRTDKGFEKNVSKGLKILEEHFENVNTKYFLPPEIMLTSEQIKILSDLGFEGTFIHKSRYNPKIRKFIPDEPYIVEGVLGSELICIPFQDTNLRKVYHRILQGNMEPSSFSKHLKEIKHDTIFHWKDEETDYLNLEGVSIRGKIFEDEKKNNIERKKLSEIDKYIEQCAEKYTDSDVRYSYQQGGTLICYPRQSLNSWLGTLHGYPIQREVEKYELKIFDEDRKYPECIMNLLLLAMNSDIFSSTEKPNTDVSININKISEYSGKSPENILSSNSVYRIGIDIDEIKNNIAKVTFLRSPRYHEGEKIVAYLKELLKDQNKIYEFLGEWKNGTPDLQKLYARVKPDIV